MNDILDQVNALFISNRTNIRYLTGFVGVEDRDAFVLLVKDKTYFFTNSLYIEQAKDLSPTLISRENPISKEVAKVCNALNIKKLGFEDTNLTVAELAKLKQVMPDVEFVPTRDRIETLRMIKRKEEMENIKLAAKITDQCFSYICKRIRPGITEARLAWEIEGFFKFRAGDVAFSPIVAYNEHSSEPHYAKRGNSPLRKNSLILLDFGARVNGYCADMTRMVFLGQPKTEWVNGYNAVLAANQKAIELLKSGERDGAVLDTAARDVIEKAGLPAYPHSLGHAVGLDIHEAPRLSIAKAETLMENMVVTVEPGVYIAGNYGVRIEDLVLLSNNGITVLSKSSKEIITL